jgi:dCTP deaminase
MMLIKAKLLSKFLRDDGPNGLTIVPLPDLLTFEDSGAASIDLRLGRWFTTFRPTRMSRLEVAREGRAPANEAGLTKLHYVPFGEDFTLHPGGFVLGITLEWLRLPPGLGGFVGGKSSWGRRGLIIETAAGIHPGFSGCLTLEMTNLGEVPIAIIPGMPICQVVFHKTSDLDALNQSAFNGRRKPNLGVIKTDPVLEKLMRPIPS